AARVIEAGVTDGIGNGETAELGSDVKVDVCSWCKSVGRSGSEVHLDLAADVSSGVTAFLGIVAHVLSAEHKRTHSLGDLSDHLSWSGLMRKISSRSAD